MVDRLKQLNQSLKKMQISLRKFKFRSSFEVRYFVCIGIHYSIDKLSFLFILFAFIIVFILKTQKDEHRALLTSKELLNKCETAIKTLLFYYFSRVHNLLKFASINEPGIVQRYVSNKILIFSSIFCVFFCNY